MLYTRPLMAIHASLPLRPEWNLSIDGVTLSNPAGASGPRPRRSAVGCADSRAQSRGEWPGVSTTAREGFCGGAECVGGGARDDDDDDDDDENLDDVEVAGDARNGEDCWG